MSKYVAIAVGVLFVVVSVLTVVFVLFPQNKNAEPEKYVVTIQNANSEYGEIDVVSIADVPENTVVNVSGNKLTINGTTVTALAKEGTAQYQYIFSGWEKPATITKDTTILAHFERNIKTYTVSLQTNSVDSSYGADGFFDEISIVVPYGTVVSANDSIVDFSFGGQVIESVRASGNENCFGVSSISIEDEIIMGPSTITANFVVKSNDKYSNLDFVIEADYASVKLKTGQTPSAVEVPRLIKISNVVYTVKTVEENGFKDLSFLTRLILSSSIETIGEGAFSGCSNLAEVTIKNTEIYTTATSPTSCGYLLNYVKVVKVLKTVSGTNAYLNDVTKFSKAEEGDFVVYRKK